MIGSVSSSSFVSYDSARQYPNERKAGPNSGFELEKDGRKFEKSDQSKKDPANPQKLDRDEQEQVDKLKRRDAEVRAHEQAHMAAAGSLAQGGPNYVYQTGPDGKQYAIGGDVKIDTSPGRTPQETIQKARQIRAAALAPAEPSAQDAKVAASAASMEMEAASKLSEKAGNNPPNATSPGNGSPGEVTSAHQLFASSSATAETGNSSGAPATYVAQAAKLYQKSGH